MDALEFMLLALGILLVCLPAVVITAESDKKQTDDQLIADVAYLKRLASDYFKTSVDCENRAFAAEQKYDALREAVAWERECIDTWEYGTALKMQALDEQVASMNAARADVDRLISVTPLPA